MSEEEVQEVQEVQEEAPKEAQKDQETEKPAGWDKVDFENDSPEKIEQRFKRLYRQVKVGQEEARQGRSVTEQLVSDNRALMDRMENWEVSQVQDRNASRYSVLEGNLQTAMDEGNAKTAASITKEIAQLEVGAAVPRQKPERPVQRDDSLPNDDAIAIQVWAQGRPEAVKGHNDHDWLASTMNAVWSDPEYSNMQVDDKLDVVERRLSKRQNKTPAVMGSEAPAPKEKKGGLNADQKHVALIMFPDKPEKDAFAAYSRGMG